MFLIFDTETTGLPKDFSAPISDTNNWPRCIQLAWQLHDYSGKLIDIKNYIIEVANFVSIQFLKNADSFLEKEWNELYKLSENTFVEETDSLKQSGAGAGLTDND